ncbi:MAG: GTPase HflX [Acetatifactor muris]|nr:GTPase HflX [Acetatifactor muris]MCM1525938.1 GTPase HflX [Bacteroides sp.]
MEEKTRVLLVGVDTGEETDFERSMREMQSLAEACDKQVAGVMTQRMAAVNKTYYIGTGKVKEVLDYAGECGAEEIIFDNTLSPSQIRNLVKVLDMPIMDRTNLILDIFALRARTNEAKMQVEMARLQYLLPRLVGMHESLSRQGGTGGSMSNRGAGEKKLELDRRRIEHRVAELRKELEDVKRSRDTERKKRNASAVPQVALVGYTNAGKSTILNRMLTKYGRTPEKQVREEDMLFATLETSVRSIEPENGIPFLLTDTVGFIHNLPHGLVKAFRSTLEEVRYADLLVQVVDFSDENYRLQMETTKETLKELEIGDIPQIIVYNKVDRCPEGSVCSVGPDSIRMAAGRGIGIEELMALIQRHLYRDFMICDFLLPYSEGQILSRLMEQAVILNREYREDGVLLKARCHRREAAAYAGYLLRTLPDAEQTAGAWK